MMIGANFLAAAAAAGTMYVYDCRYDDEGQQHSLEINIEADLNRNAQYWTVTSRSNSPFIASRQKARFDWVLPDGKGEPWAIIKTPIGEYQYELASNQSGVGLRIVKVDGGAIGGIYHDTSLVLAEGMCEVLSFPKTHAGGAA